MKPKVAWFSIGLLALVGGSWLGVALRSKYESRGRWPAGSFYATQTGVAATDVGEPMGGKTAGEYFDDVLVLLKNQFVDPIGDETKLAHGALTYMLEELQDPCTRFYDPEAWRARLDTYEGLYRGVGVDLAVLWKGDGERYEIPLTVTSVVDGSPAAKAGLMAGDVIEEIDGRWVASRSLFMDLSDANRKFQAGEITKEEFDSVFEALREKSRRSMSIDDAIKELTLEETGTVRVTVMRGGKALSVEMPRSKFNVLPIEQKENAIRIRSFAEGVDVKLADMIKGKQAVTLDVSDNVGGSFEVMLRCLQLLIPAGEFANIKLDPDKPLRPLSLDTGTKVVRKVTVLVNRGTSHETEVFVTALRDKAGATVVGAPTFGLGVKTERFTLADGSGYTIAQGRFFDLTGRPLYTQSDPPKDLKKNGETQ